MAKKVTADDINEWIRLHVEDGLSCRQIAKKCGWGKTTVNKHLEAAGVLRRKRFVTDVQIDEWVEEYLAGTSPYELSKMSGFDDETIRLHLKERGVPMRPAGGPVQYSHDYDTEWQRLYLSGLIPREISEQYEASETTISTRLRKMGTVMRAAGESNQRVSSSMISAWIEKYESGMSSVQIAEEFGFSSTTVLEYLRKAGVDTGPLITQQESFKLKQRYELGESIQKLASEYGVTDTYIRMKLKERGAEIRDPVRGFVFAEDVVMDWCRRYESGESMSSIAFSAGVKSADTIRRRLVENGVEIREKVSSTASSWQEWAVYFYMRKAFPGCDVSNNAPVETRKGKRYPDVIVKNSNGSLKIAIEYDGAFWHGNPTKREKDAEKTNLLEEIGYTVFRIVEDPKDQEQDSLFEIHCSSDRDGIESAIKTLLDMLGKDESIVDFDRDTPAISELYYEAKNRTAHGLEWVELYENGYSTNAIAEMFSTTPTTVSTSLKMQGIEIRHKPTDDAERQIWLSMYKEGVSVPSIAASRGVDKSVIYRYLKAQGIKFERYPKKPIVDLDLEWKRLYEEECKPLSFIAEKYGVTSTTVSNHLKKQNVTIRNNHGR